MKEIGLTPPLGAPARPDPTAPARPEQGEAGKGSFGEILKSAIQEVGQLQQEADQAVQSLMAGRDASIHATLLAVEKADLSFRLMMQVRNKIIAAYEEVMRMPV